jgi:hypothetical protein
MAIVSLWAVLATFMWWFAAGRLCQSNADMDRVLYQNRPARPTGPFPPPPPRREPYYREDPPLGH